MYRLYIEKSFNSNSHLGVTLTKRKRKIYPAVHITYIDYADDIAVITDSLIDANIRLHQIEGMVKDIGLHINPDKTGYIYLNQENQIHMKSLSCHAIKRASGYNILTQFNMM